MSNESTLKVQLPNRETIDVAIVKLASGRVVVRTLDELAKKPLETTAAPAPASDR